MKFKTYPKYKESGVQWLGKIPEGWGVKKVKHFSISIAGGTPNTNILSYWDGNIPWLPSGMVQNNLILEKEVETLITFEGLNNSSTKWIKKDAVLIALTGATCANIGFLTFRATANQSVIGIECDNTSYSKFLFYYLLSQREQILINQTGGAQAGINKDDVKNIVCTFPSSKEQEIIATFLDKKVLELNTLIEKDKKLIELLKEKRVASINHVVTKGLNPSAKMKDSGIEWIGEIPEGWEVKKIKFFTKENRNKSTENDNIIKFIGLENIESMTGKIILIDSKEEFDGEALKFKKDNVLFSKLRPYLTKVIVADTDGFCTSELIIYNCPSNVSPIFLKYRLLSNGYIDYVNSLTEGVKMPRADPVQLSNIKLPIPPKSEQIQIAEYLDEATSKIDQIIEMLERKIELLEEYKRSLIHHVVTGKVDVREEN